MNDFTYLTTELPKYINMQKRFSYVFIYNFVKLKRYLALTVMAFSFQYLCIYHLQSFYPIYPIYPAMGITFAVVSILGENAILGLLSGAVCAYYLKGFSVSSIMLYSLADIACASFGAYLCRNIFTSDIPRHATIALWARFFSVSVLVSCLSGLCRLTALILNEATLPSFMTLFFIYLDLCLADLNAIIIFYAFLGTWLSIYMSREKISSNTITYYHMAAFVIFVAVSVLMMKQLALIYVLFFGMLATIFFAYSYGIAIATLLTYVISMLYLCYFTGHQLYYLKWLGIGWYTLAPGLLLLFVSSTICISNENRRLVSMHRS